jgi:hypothetical protein
MTQTPDNREPMSFGRIVEIVGLIAIVLSLVFLGYELKRSNDIAEAEAVAEIYTMQNEMGIVMAESPDLARVFNQAQTDVESLNGEDLWTFYVILEYLVNVNEAAWKYFDKGIIDRKEADYYTRGLCRMIGLHPSIGEAWRSNRENRMPGFYDYVTEVCELDVPDGNADT